MSATPDLRRGGTISREGGAPYDPRHHSSGAGRALTARRHFDARCLRLGHQSTPDTSSLAERLAPKTAKASYGTLVTQRTDACAATHIADSTLHKSLLRWASPSGAFRVFRAEGRRASDWIWSAIEIWPPDGSPTPSAFPCRRACWHSYAALPIRPTALAGVAGYCLRPANPQWSTETPGRARNLGHEGLVDYTSGDGDVSVSEVPVSRRYPAIPEESESVSLVHLRNRGTLSRGVGDRI
ncbi:hypothetical protein CFIICLFH_1872 [Methylobacterium goesingense]|uniref:Uncharacterized protein n=1 Tax=Methylobacterium goesingense TaxID=243690 RepID=A0ABV2L7C0_9HYPH|nr:hypothetical protein CFIICLFH_1872 [Methylobacterium goesingense]